LLAEAKILQKITTVSDFVAIDEFSLEAIANLTLIFFISGGKIINSLY